MIVLIALLLLLHRKRFSTPGGWTSTHVTPKLRPNASGLYSRPRHCTIWRYAHGIIIIIIIIIVILIVVMLILGTS